MYIKKEKEFPFNSSKLYINFNSIFRFKFLIHVNNINSKTMNEIIIKNVKILKSKEEINDVFKI